MVPLSEVVILSYIHISFSYLYRKEWKVFVPSPHSSLNLSSYLKNCLFRIYLCDVGFSWEFCSPSSWVCSQSFPLSVCNFPFWCAALMLQLRAQWSTAECCKQACVMSMYASSCCLPSHHPNNLHFQLTSPTLLHLHTRMFPFDWLYLCRPSLHHVSCMGAISLLGQDHRVSPVLIIPTRLNNWGSLS